MDLITFNCNTCQQILKVSADNAGKQAKCPRCGAGMVIPDASTTGPQGPPPQPSVLPYPEVEDHEGNQGTGRGRPRPPTDDYYDDDRGGRERRSRPPEDDYDADYDRPGRRGRSRGRADDYEEDDPGYRPRRRPDRYEKDYEEDYDRMRQPGLSLRKRWGLVRIALLIVFISACVAAGAFGLQQIGMIIVSINMFSVLGGGFPGGGGMTAAMRIIQISLIISTLASVGAIVGYGFGVVAPTRRGALGLIIATLAVAVVGLILSIVFRLVRAFRDDFAALGLGQGATVGQQILLIFVQLFFFAEILLLALFLWAVAVNFRSNRLARGSMGLVIYTGCAAGYHTIVPLILMVFKPTTIGGAKALLVIALILYWIGAFIIIGMLVWLLVQLWRTRDVID
jgi:hypothetical protein